MTDRDPDALGWRTLIGFGVAAMALAAVATPLLLLLAPEPRAIVLRAAVVLYAAGALPRLLRALRAISAPGDAQALARRLRPPPPPARPDPALPRIAAQLRALRRFPRARRAGHAPALLARLRAIAARDAGAVPPDAGGRLSERAELDVLLDRIRNAP